MKEIIRNFIFYVLLRTPEYFENLKKYFYVLLQKKSMKCCTYLVVSWSNFVVQKHHLKLTHPMCKSTINFKLIDRIFSLWARILETKVSGVLCFITSVNMSVLAKSFHVWRQFRSTYQSILREWKAILWRFIVKWQKFVVSKKKNQTPAEKFR